MGWDDSVPKPVCVELDPPAQTRVAAFNVKLVNQSRLSTHPLASVDPKTVKYGSLAASHTNAVLRMFKDGVRHEAAESIMGSPTLSPEGLKAHDAGFYNAVCNGLEWTVIGSLAVRTWPNLTQLLCEASNTNGQLQRQESELQLAQRIFNVIESMGPSVDYKEVKGRILRSKPLCASSVPHLFKFLLKFGGGNGCSLFFESCDFLKCSKTSQRILGHDFWELLSQDCKTPGVLLPLTRHAILRVALAHPNPRHITVSDVRKILSQGMLQKVTEAEQLMGEVRGLLPWHPGHPKCYLIQILMWEMVAVEVLLEKKEVKYLKSIQSALQEQIDSISEAGGPVISTKWESFRYEPDENNQAVASPSRPKSIPILKCRNFDQFFCFSYICACGGFPKGKAGLYRDSSPRLLGLSWLANVGFYQCLSYVRFVFSHFAHI